MTFAERFGIYLAHRVVDAACWGFTAYLYVRAEDDPPFDELIPEVKTHFPDCKVAIRRPSLLLIDWTPRGKTRTIGVLKTDLNST